MVNSCNYFCIVYGIGGYGFFWKWLVVFLGFVNVNLFLSRNIVKCIYENCIVYVSKEIFKNFLGFMYDFIC